MLISKALHYTLWPINDFYRTDMPEFNELVEFMTSGPVRALGLTKGDTGEGVIELWRNIIGPFDPEEAKKESSDSIRVRLSIWRVFPMVISSEFHVWQYRDNDHREDVLHFIFSIFDWCIRLDMVPV